MVDGFAHRVGVGVGGYHHQRFVRVIAHEPAQGGKTGGAGHVQIEQQQIGGAVALDQTVQLGNAVRVLDLGFPPEQLGKRLPKQGVIVRNQVFHSALTLNVVMWRRTFLVIASLSYPRP